MEDLPDLFPGFEAHWISTSIGKMFVRVGGKGPVLLLLHGYPQTNVMWHRVAPTLAEHFTLIIPDLPGYGWSPAPASTAEHAHYTKRSMASVLIEMMSALGHVQFGLIGHDRGGRVAYRMTLDHPGRVTKLGLLDIVPTLSVWHGMDRAVAMKVWHWMMLAQPSPVPETIVGADPLGFWNLLVPMWTKRKTLSVFDPGALAHYHAFFQVPERIRATCDDYRAGRRQDLKADEADRAAGKMLDCPLLVLWGDAGVPGESGPLAIWREWAKDVRGHAIDSGHFLPEENPADTAEAILAFFREA